MNRRRSVFSHSLEYYPWFKGAGHGSELLFLFPIKYSVTIPADDISLSLTMMKYWSNFAKTGYVLYCIDEKKRWVLYLFANHYERSLSTDDNVHIPQLTRITK